MKKILLIEDDPDYQLLIQSKLQEIFYDPLIIIFSRPQDFMEFIEKESCPWDIILSDYYLEDETDGLDIYYYVKNIGIPSLFILTSSFDNILQSAEYQIKKPDRIIPKEEIILNSPEYLKPLFT